MHKTDVINVRQQLLCIVLTTVLIPSLMFKPAVYLTLAFIVKLNNERIVKILELILNYVSLNFYDEKKKLFIFEKSSGRGLVPQLAATSLSLSLLSFY